MLVLTLTRYQTKRAAPSPAPTPSPGPTPPASLIELGRASLDLPPTWVLVARDFDSVYEIQLATGVSVPGPIYPVMSDGAGHVLVVSVGRGSGRARADARTRTAND